MLTHILSRLVHQPLLCTPAYVEVVLSVLSDRIGIQPLVSADVQDAYRRPSKEAYIDRASGIAVFPIVGSLVHRSEYVNPASGMTGYTAIQNDLQSLAATSGVRGILLDVDSPGGEVAGLSELASYVADLAQKMPVYAVANGLMASAAYWLSSGATRIYAAPGSSVGSIGVVTAHIDRSKELEKKGQHVTLIHAGKHKVEGNQFEPLPDDVRASIEARVMSLYEDFVGAVAEHRGLDEAAVKATEAGIFGPDEAVEIGLADGRATFGEVLKALTHAVTRPSVMGYSNGAAMKETLIYGEADLARVRSEATAEAQRAVETTKASAVADALAGSNKAVAEAVASLFPESTRAKAFCEALNDGVPVATAAKVAALVPEAKPADPAPETAKSRTEADVDRIMSGHNSGVRGDAGNGDPATAREKRLAEIASLGKRPVAVRA